MEWWRLSLGLIFMLGCVSVIAWTFGQHVRRGYKDHLWIWVEANDRAVMFALTFGLLVGAKWLFNGFNDEVVIFGAAGLVFAAMPYIAYTTGRLLGIGHRARQRRRLS